MRNLTNFIEFKGIHINEEGLIQLSYVGEEGILFYITMGVSVDGDTIAFDTDEFDIVSKEIRKKYSQISVLEYIKTDLREYGKLLGKIVLSITSIEKKIGEKVACMDLLHGIQKFYDMGGNSVATSTNVLDKDELEIYKMLDRLFIPSND